MKMAFGIAEDHLTPAELIRHLLTAEIDLLFFGGIGTFVKARGESHADVGDKANDALRIDGETHPRQGGRRGRQSRRHRSAAASPMR